jgi:hypothetical protein
MTKPAAPLKSGIARGLDGVLGVAILDLTSGQQLLIQPDVVFPQASSIKIAVLAELYHQAEQAAAGTPNKAMLTDPYVVRTSDGELDPPRPTRGLEDRQQTRRTRRRPQRLRHCVSQEPSVHPLRHDDLSRQRTSRRGGYHPYFGRRL